MIPEDELVAVIAAVKTMLDAGYFSEDNWIGSAYHANELMDAVASLEDALVNNAADDDE